MIQHLVLLLVGEGLLDHALPDDLGQVDWQPVAHLYIMSCYIILYYNISYILYYIILYYIRDKRGGRCCAHVERHRKSYDTNNEPNVAYTMLTHVIILHTYLLGGRGSTAAYNDHYKDIVIKSNHYNDAHTYNDTHYHYNEANRGCRGCWGSAAAYNHYNDIVMIYNHYNDAHTYNDTHNIIMRRTTRMPRKPRWRCYNAYNNYNAYYHYNHYYHHTEADHEDAEEAAVAVL